LLGQQGNHSILSAAQIKLKLENGFGHTILYGYTPEIIASARIFACSSELDFAGHPLLGAASSIHEKCLPTFKDVCVKFKLNGNRFVNVMVSAIGNRYRATMSQGRPIFLGQITSIPQITPFLKALNLTVEGCDARFPAEVISTGLKYLILPVTSGIESAKITVGNLGEMLSSINADFVYVVDINQMMARTWENDGSSEDAATGSAAGPLGAYLVKHRIANVGEIVTINQGGFIHRPSKLTAQVIGDFEDILVGGDVCIMGNGQVKITS
jgi:PhzF family phenazine biosynthesis protein